MTFNNIEQNIQGSIEEKISFEVFRIPNPNVLFFLPSTEKTKKTNSENWISKF